MSKTVTIKLEDHRMEPVEGAFLIVGVTNRVRTTFRDHDGGLYDKLLVPGNTILTEDEVGHLCSKADWKVVIIPPK